MIARRWVHHATLWTALSKATTGFVALNPGGYVYSTSNSLSNDVGKNFLTYLGSIKNESIKNESITSGTISSPSFSSTDNSNPSQTNEKRRYWSRKWRRPLGVSLSVVGFCQSAIHAILTPHRPPKLRSAIMALRRYLRETSIDEEFRSVLNHRLLANLLILRRIQRQTVPSIDTNAPSSMVLPCPFEALRFMKYATAVYGDAMIRAAELELDDRFDVRLLGTPSQEQVRKHCRLKDDDEIVSFDIGYDGDSSHLRHMIIVDHSHQNIILAIRGTFSLSEIAVDMAAFSRPFCDGEAHSEMATMAELVWTKAEPSIRQLKTKYPDYDFVLTGHSLGAGVATLTHMMIQSNDKDNTFFQSRCVVFAAPPTISHHKPLKRCVNFIHDQDIIPFLSVDAVRRLCKSIQTIEEQGMTFWQRWKAVRSQAWENEVLLKKLNGIPPVIIARDGAPALQCAAETNVWLRRHAMNSTSFFDDQEEDESYTVELWDSTELANVGIRLEITPDHLPSLYEKALSRWAETDNRSRNDV